MKRYTIGLITGILLTASAFMWKGAKSENFGDITVKSITIKTNGEKTVYIGTGEGGAGFMTTSNADGKRTTFLGTSTDGFGMLQTFTSNAKKTTYIGGGVEHEGDGGFMRTFNNDEMTSTIGTGTGGRGGFLRTYVDGKVTVYLGTSTDNDGMIDLFDRDGNFGWSASGKN